MEGCYVGSIKSLRNLFQLPIFYAFKLTNMKSLKLSFLLSVLFLFACNTSKKTNNQVQTSALVVILEPEAEKIIDKNATVEVLAEGFTWSEGPVWVDELNAVLFSDVPENKIYKWTLDDSLSVFLEPSGYTGSNKSGSGSNGLMLDASGKLILCQHGDRRLAMLNAGLTTPSSLFVTIADRFDNKKFNSPNDLHIKSNGDIYFTDPPYGLPNDSAREIEFNGVYKVNDIGEVTLLVDSLTRPNGIALSLDEKTAYVANSDPEKTVWYTYKLDSLGNFTDARLFYDATYLSNTEKGKPDGLKVHKSGNIFATGPGGVLIFTPEARHIATIRTGAKAANCAFDTEQKYLYITATDMLMRVALK